MSRPRALEIRIGLFASLGLGLILAGIWLLGSTHGLFSSRDTFYLSLPNAEGVTSGATVLIAGVPSGRVESVALVPAEQGVKVVLGVSSGSAQSIRGDSVARVTTHGVLGDKVIEISAGDPALAPLRPRSVIPAESTSTFSSLFGPKGDRVVGRADEVLRHLDELLVTLSADGRAELLVDNLIAASGSVAVSAHLLNQQLRGLKVKEAVDNLDSILAKIDHGVGTAAGLINDPEIYDDAKALVGETNQNRIVRNLVRSSVRSARERQLEAEKQQQAPKQEAGGTGE
jgi:phospholipid/cholesterol/gamma-HCH transport system substrate-binding protein